MEIVIKAVAALAMYTRNGIGNYVKIILNLKNLLFIHSCWFVCFLFCVFGLVTGWQGLQHDMAFPTIPYTDTSARAQQGCAIQP